MTFADKVFFLPEDFSVVNGSYQVTYNSGYLFLRWETSGGVSVSDENGKTTIVTVSGAGTLRAVGSGETIEYAYDDGTAEYILFNRKAYSEMGAVRFMSVLSDKLTSARIYIYGISPIMRTSSDPSSR